MKSQLVEVQTGFEPLFFHIQADFQWQRPFSEGCAGLVESQRLFSDEQLAVIKNACEFALEDDATLSYAEEKQLHSVQELLFYLLQKSFLLRCVFFAHTIHLHS